MFKRFALAIFLFPVVLASAQNWKPLNQADKYNYSKDGTLYATVWADSVKIVNGDSVFFLNKILKKVKNSTPWIYIEGYYLQDQPQFSFSDIRYKPNGEFQLETDSIHKYLIKPYALLNDTWVYDSINSDTAEIIKVTDSLIFGNIDSVKTIKLSGDDTVIISRNYGILQFPLFDSINKQLVLVGIEGRNIGTMVPEFGDFFDFNIGDVFYYRYQSSGHWANNITYKKIIITDTIAAGSILKTYNSEYWARSITTDPYGTLPDDTAFTHDGNHIMSFSYSDLNYNFLSNYNDQILDNGTAGMKYKPVLYGYDNVFKTTTKSHPYYPYCKLLGSDTIVETTALASLPYSCSPECHYACYGEHVGMISKRNLIYYGNPYPDSNGEYLIACIRSGVTYGTIPDESIFKVNTYPLYQEGISIYPNPAHDQFIVENYKFKHEYEIKLYNVKQQLVIDKIIGDKKFVLDVSFLSGGIYFVKIINDDSAAVIKVLKY